MSDLSAVTRQRLGPRRLRLHGFRYLCRLRPMRKTHALVQVALALMAEPTARHWGYELSRTAGVRSGVLYPILRRMEDDGWLEAGWEDPERVEERRPPRRYYTLTEKGLSELGALLYDARRDARFGGIIGEGIA